MNIRHIAIAVVAAAAVMGTADMASAAPGDHGNGTGGCIDNFYGNATNPRPSGHGVLPSQSPGPFVNNPTDPENPTTGPSVGDVMQYGHSIGLTGSETHDLICTFP
jgi:hypothetical protein